MSKILIIFLSLFCILYANEVTIKVKNNQNLEKIIDKDVNAKQNAYLEEQKKLELENEKLEEEGFCSCNNS